MDENRRSRNGFYNVYALYDIPCDRLTSPVEIKLFVGSLHVSIHIHNIHSYHTSYDLALKANITISIEKILHFNWPSYSEMSGETLARTTSIVVWHRSCNPLALLTAIQ